MTIGVGQDGVGGRVAQRSVVQLCEAPAVVGEASRDEWPALLVGRGAAR